MFKPFSNENSGARSVVRQKLSFLTDTESGGDGDNLNFDRRESLSFGHDHRRTDFVSDVKFVTELLRQHDTAQSSELPSLFDKLVYNMRSLKHSDMIKIYYDDQIISNTRTKKFFQDALPLLKTDAGVTLMKDILISGELTTEIRDIWFSSLAFYKNPSRGMLILLSSFIKPNAPKSALLGISSLASTFCSNNPQCGDIAEFNEVLSKAGCKKKGKKNFYI